MRIIIGLGNPGEQYSSTRHNIGFMALDALVQDLGLEWEENKKFKSLIAKIPSSLSGKAPGDGFLIKPQTFMNNSGQAVQAIMNYYHLLPKSFLGIKKDSDLSTVVTVIHDDIDIKLGKYKTSVNSRSAGHRGVESLIKYLKTKNFARIRIGIRNELIEKMPVEKFVLQKFSAEEMTIVKNIVTEIKNTLINQL